MSQGIHSSETNGDPYRTPATGPEAHEPAPLAQDVAGLPCWNRNGEGISCPKCGQLGMFLRVEYNKAYVINETHWARACAGVDEDGREASEEQEKSWFIKAAQDMGHYRSDTLRVGCSSCSFVLGYYVPLDGQTRAGTESRGPL